MKKWICLLASLVLFCSVIGLASASLADEEAVTVTFSTDPVTLMVGKYTTVKTKVAPYAAAKKGVTFASSDESVATVSSKGKVTGVAAGECQITATSDYDTTVSASLAVTVIVPVKKLTVTAESDKIFIGQTLQLTIGYDPEDATLQSVTYDSLNDSVASVSEDGLVTGLKRGSATISVRSADENAKATYKVNVQQAPESVTIKQESAEASVGKKVSLRATVLPTNANDRTVSWTSADESVATVSSKGVITIQGAGNTTVTAACNADPSVTASIPVTGLQLAESVTFDSDVYNVYINETLQLSPIVLPANTSDPSVTYKVGNNKIATVDENGLVTGLKGGKTTVYAYAADGSRKKGHATIQVIVPVTGVSFKYKDVRVGEGNYGTFYATIAPSTASDKNMTWVSSDDRIATVTGTTNRFKIKGHNWGRCKVTGTTEDGGFTVVVNVDIGSLKHAVTVTSVSVRDGKPYLKLKNKSNMNITQVRFEMRGYNSGLQPIDMSTKGDKSVLKGAYDLPLASGESTKHGVFTFYNKSDYPGLYILQFCITGWSTDTGYYDSNGVLQYNYNLSESHWEWVTYPEGQTPLLATN